MKKILILNSGGLDSAVMKLLAEQQPDTEVISLYVDIGHDYAWKEKQALDDSVEVLDFSDFQAKGFSKDGNAMKSIFIPGRNMLLAAIAACKYLPDEIWMGALMGEIHSGATDKNKVFLEKINDLFKYVFSPFKKDVRVVFPFVDRGWGKLQVVQWAVVNGYSDLVLKSSSCMSGERGNCGKCGVCLRRAGIFMQVGLKEEYNVDPFKAEENLDLIISLLKAEIAQDNSHYDKYRREEVIPALQMLYPNQTLKDILKIYENQ